LVSVARSLEFVVIGAQKAGTTTLWELLRQRPDVWVPAAKELPYFSHEEVYAEGLERLLMRHDAPDDDRPVGTVTPHYMHGWQAMTTAKIAARMAHDLPDLKLVALLRDPVQRACSQHAMAAARGRESRSLDEAIEAELAPTALQAARTRPGDLNTYVVQGEYGRILSEFLAVFPSDQLYVELTSRLAADPDLVLRRVLAFLGVRGSDLPIQPRLRLLAGGTTSRTSDEACMELADRLAVAPGEQRSALARAWAHARPELHNDDVTSLTWHVERFVAQPSPLSPPSRAGLRWELRKVWNVRPGPRPALRPDLKDRLIAHYTVDAALLHQVVRVETAWCDGSN
jgi:Sulfotransferase domain